MSPFGFGGTRDLDGTPCWPDYAGSGGGTASPEMVRRIEAGDRGTEDQTSPRQVLTHLYGNPVALPREVEDALVEAMLEMAIGPANYPGDTAVSAELARRRAGRARRQQRDLPQVLRPVRLRGHRGRARGAVDPRRRRPDRLGHLPGGPGPPRRARRHTGLAGRGRVPGAADGGPAARGARPLPGRRRRYTEHVLPGCGHSPHLERPAEFTAAVTGFLAADPHPLAPHPEPPGPPGPTDTTAPQSTTAPQAPSAPHYRL